MNQAVKAGAGNRQALLFAVLASVLSATVLLATSPFLAIVWDEGFTLGREERVRQWFRALEDPAAFAATWYQPTPLERLIPADDERPPLASAANTRAKLLRWPALDWFWPFARQEPHGHPPFYAIVGLVGDLLNPSAEPLARARLGPMLVFSLASGVVFWFFARRYGNWPAAAAWGAWLLSPRVFAHAHYAHYDAILTSLWVCSLLAFSMAVETSQQTSNHGPWRPRWPWVVTLGMLLGCAMATKLTGWFIPLPFLAWTLLYRERKGVVALLAAGSLALLVAWLLVPPWWGNPIGGLEAFFESNLTRSKTTRIPTLFLGQIYVTPQSSLPWYNTLAWTAMVTPALFLFLAAGGVVRALRWPRSDRFGTLVLAHWGFLIALRALPFAPGHDGIRQFLPAFGCLALLVGLGAAEAINRKKVLGQILTSAALLEAALSVALMMPVPLSYFSPLVGGLPGATRLGMEPTYYWDALDQNTLDWLNTNTRPGHGILFCTNPTAWLYLRETDKLKPLVAGLEAQDIPLDWYIVQNRTGMFNPVDRGLVDRLGTKYVINRKWGVPLVWAFPFDEFEAQRTIERQRLVQQPGPEIGR